MNKSDAGRLLKHFNPQELKDITRSIANLREISPDVVQRLVDEFAADFSSGTNLVGSTGDAEKLLAEALPAEQVSELMSDVLGSSNQSLWDQISRVAEDDLANYLAGEHPQTAALVLSKISPWRPPACYASCRRVCATTCRSGCWRSSRFRMRRCA